MQCAFTALDAWFGLNQAVLAFRFHDGDLSSLAGSLPEAETAVLSFSGLPHADASASLSPRDALTGPPASELRYICSEGSCNPAYPLLRLRHAPEKRYFDARKGIYDLLLGRSSGSPEPGHEPEQLLFEMAILSARYPIKLEPERLESRRLPEQLPALFQRDLLLMLLDSVNPAAGFELLLNCGFLDRYWPELADLSEVDHAKDFHPEGDGWRHTMETFSYRKTKDPLLALGLLLHDIGKPEASARDGKRFAGHADIGGQQAQRFMRRLGFPETLVQAVFFLVRYHMLPAALPTLPPWRIEAQLNNPLFPVLLELYRCDELSTFRGPDGYYAACATYRAWCKEQGNPYREFGRKT